MNKLIKERYISYFTPFYISAGFEPLKKISGFIKNEFESYIGPSATYPGSITLRPSFSIKNSEIQKILETVFPTEIGLCTYLRVQDMDFAFECGVCDDKITYSPHNYYGSGTSFTGGGGGSYYYDIEEDTNLAPILEDHKYYMENVTFPFFEKMSTLQGIDTFINDRLLEGDIENFMLEERQMFLKKVNSKREAFSGLIAAKLNRRTYYNELIERYKVMYN
ncbi:MAG: hypothetical protein WAT79_11060 [Saprospiraceae bacterium]